MKTSTFPPPLSHAASLSSYPSSSSSSSSSFSSTFSSLPSPSPSLSPFTFPSKDSNFSSTLNEQKHLDSVLPSSSSSSSFSFMPSPSPSFSASFPPPSPLSSSSSSVVSVSSLVSLCDHLRRLALEDDKKTSGSEELSLRALELKNFLLENEEEISSYLLSSFASSSSSSLLSPSSSSPLSPSSSSSSSGIEKSLLHIQKALLSAISLMKKTLKTTFRRSSKFKNPIRISINDLVVGMGKIGSSLSFMMAKEKKRKEKEEKERREEEEEKQKLTKEQEEKQKEEERRRKEQEENEAKKMRALPLLRDGEEEYLLAEKFLYGYGVKKDERKALEMYEKAAEKGYLLAFFSLGSFFRTGEVTGEKNLFLAFFLLKKAAFRGSLEAHNLLGQMYEEGEVVAEEEEENEDEREEAEEKENHKDREHSRKRSNFLFDLSYFSLKSACKEREKVSKDSNKLAEEERRRRKNLVKAIEHYQIAANKGNVEAQHNLGFLYENGGEDEVNFVPVDMEAAFAWYEEAAKQGFSKAQNNLAVLYLTGKKQKKKEREERSPKEQKSSAKDLLKAFQLFSLAAEQDNPCAHFHLGLFYSNGLSVVEKDQEKAFQHFNWAAQLGHSPSQSQLGFLLFQKKNYEAAFSCFERAAREKEKESLYFLGLFYQHGLFVEKNIATAALFYEQAAKEGHPYAQLELGHFYMLEKGPFAKDLAKAVFLYGQAAEKQVVEAENTMGILYEEGLGVVQDNQEALYWYEKAASSGYPDAFFNLGLFCEKQWRVKEEERRRRHHHLSEKEKKKEQEEEEEEKHQESIKFLQGKALGHFQEAAKRGSLQAKLKLEHERNGRS